MKRISRRIILAAMLLLVIFIFHNVLLTAMGGLLASRQSTDSYRYVVLLGGDRRFDVASQLFENSSAEEVVVFQGPPTPLVQCGILPPGHEIAIRELTDRGTPPTRITLVPVHERNGLWSTVAALDEWLAAHEGNVLLLTGEFNSRRVRVVLDRVLEPQHANRIFVRPLAHRDYNRENWWRSRLGAKAFVDASIFLLHTVIMPAPRAEDRIDWQPSDLGRRLGVAHAGSGQAG